MTSEFTFAVAARIVLALSPLGSLLQDDNQLSSPLTSYSRCKRPTSPPPIVDCTSSNTTKYRRVSIYSATESIHIRVDLSDMYAYSSISCVFPPPGLTTHSPHLHSPSSRLSYPRRGYIQHSFGHYSTPSGHGHWSTYGVLGVTSREVGGTCESRQCEYENHLYPLPIWRSVFSCDPLAPSRDSRYLFK